MKKGTLIELTKLPLLDSVVIKQSGGRLFLSAIDSIIIDRLGLINLIRALIGIKFLSVDDILGKEQDEN